MQIIVKDITGPYAIAPDAGEALYNLMNQTLVAGKVVELDFSDVKVFASPFFNRAIGRFLRDLTPEQLSGLLRIENLNEQGQSVLSRVITNATHYYSDPTHQKAVDKAIAEYSANF